MAVINPISTTLRLTINMGMDGGKQVTKTISVTNIRETASADVLAAVAAELGELLEFPVEAIKKHSTGLLVE